MLLARGGRRVVVWARSEAEASALRAAGESPRQPGLRFPPSLQVTAEAEAAFLPAEMVVVAVPAQRVRENLRALAAAFDWSSLFLSAVKGLERESGQRMSEVMVEELPWLASGQLCALSGPNLSKEIARGLPSATVVASASAAASRAVQEALMSPALRVYTSEDMVGVELGGALKNIVAIGAGMADGFGSGDNAKAALLTRGLAEMTRLGVAAGAHPLTFAGLAGMGDLVATAQSRLSRNRRVGEELARGRPLQEILAGMDEVAEGVETTRAARELARRLGVEMPITEALYEVLFAGKEPRRALAELMSREPTHELRGLGRS